MDCGVWRLEEEPNCDCVVRIRGSEYQVSWAELDELSFHIRNVLRISTESLSTDYLNLPAPNLGAKITGGLLDLLGLAKPTIRRRA